MLVRFAFAFLALCSSVVHANADGESTQQFSVSVETRGSNASDAKRYLEEALRSLHNVEIVNKDPSYTIRLITDTIETNGATAPTIAYSWLTVRNSNPLTEFFKYHPPAWGVTRSLTKTSVILLDHQLSFGGSGSVERQCRTYIEQFKARVLTPLKTAPDQE